MFCRLLTIKNHVVFKNLQSRVASSVRLNVVDGLGLPHLERNEKLEEFQTNICGYCYWFLDTLLWQAWIFILYQLIR